MPKITLTSFGGSQQVTGSCHLLQVDNFKILLDCGLFQGNEENYKKNWQALGFNPETLHAVILTHAHLDHCGRLPLLYQRGYRGKIYTTEATAQLADLVLADNLEILTEKIQREHLPLLYTPADLQKVKNNWQLLDYYQVLTLADGLKLKFYQAGHILGAAIVELTVGEQKIVFSGDLGGQNMPLVKDLDHLDRADYLIMESTYGDRQHETTKEREQKLLTAVREVTVKNSTLVISVFAIERTQDILKALNDHYETHVDFRVPVFVDSPLAIAATKIYQRHLNLLNPAAQATIESDRDIFDFPHLSVTPSSRQSKTINLVRPPKIILAGSGMAEGGRVLHHLARYVSEAKNHILFMGFQVPGTLGWQLCNGAFELDYFGKKIPIKATIEQIDAYSAHGDQHTLLQWLDAYRLKPKKIFLVHGDQAIMENFSATIKKQLNLPAEILQVGQAVTLE